MNLNGERVATVSAFLTVGFSFDDEQECMHLNPERKGPVKRREDWRWSSHNNFAFDKAAVAACPIQIDYVRLPLGYRA